jgi:hypothetical protein
LLRVPIAPDPAPGAEELWHHHVPYGTGNANRQKRALVSLCILRLQTRLLVRRALASPRALWHRALHPTGEGSRVTTCLMAPDSSLAWEGSGVIMCPTHPDHHFTGLWYHHVSCGSRSTSRCERALKPPCALWPSASKACPCVPKTHDIRLIIASPGTRSRQHIKYIQDKSYTAYD